MRKLLAALLCTFLFACHSEKKTDQSIDSTVAVQMPKTDTLTFTYDSVKVYSKAPVSADQRVTDTAKAVILYPVFQDTVLNNFLQDQVCKSANNAVDKQYFTYKEFASGFIHEFDDFQINNEDRIQTWFLDIKLRVLMQKPGYASFSLDHLDYTGGAHPNPTFFYINYDLDKHQPIHLDALLKKGSMLKLQAIAEKIFRKNEGLTPTQSLANGYFFENNKFHLNQNFTITSQGLLFVYNPYEIKPYSSGRTRLEIPFSEIKDLINPNSILSRFL